MAAPLSQLFTDISSEKEIDSFYSQKELDTLYDLCVSYNDKLSSENGGHRIDIEEIKNDKIGMIIALWGRNQDIPEALTWGQPYDEGLKNAIKFEYDNTMRENDHTLIYAKRMHCYRIITTPYKEVAAYLNGVVAFYRPDCKVAQNNFIITLNQIAQNLGMSKINAREDIFNETSKLKDRHPIVFAYILLSIGFGGTLIPDIPTVRIFSGFDHIIYQFRPL